MRRRRKRTFWDPFSDPNTALSYGVGELTLTHSSQCEDVQDSTREVENAEEQTSWWALKTSDETDKLGAKNEEEVEKGLDTYPARFRAQLRNHLRLGPRFKSRIDQGRDEKL